MKCEGNNFIFMWFVKCYVNFNMLIDLVSTLLPAVVKKILLKGSGPNKYLLFWVLKISKK